MALDVWTGTEFTGGCDNEKTAGWALAVRRTDE